MDFFKEKIIKRKLSFNNIILQGLIMLAASFVIVFSFFYLSVFAAFITLAAGFGAWYLITSFNTEYEYIVTNGEIDVDKIIARRRRARMITVKASEFEIFAPLNDKYKNYNNSSYKAKLDFGSGNTENQKYFAVFNSRKHGGKVFMIFEPSDEMIENFKVYNPKNVFMN